MIMGAVFLHFYPSTGLPLKACRAGLRCETKCWLRTLPKAYLSWRGRYLGNALRAAQPWRSVIRNEPVGTALFHRKRVFKCQD
jgi:hypothetical protein